MRKPERPVPRARREKPQNSRRLGIQRGLGSRAGRQRPGEWESRFPRQQCYCPLTD